MYVAMDRVVQHIIMMPPHAVIHTFPNTLLSMHYDVDYFRVCGSVL